MKRRLTVLGATGSIGLSTLDVVARHPDRFEVVALSGHHQIDQLAHLCRRFLPKYAVVGDAQGAARLRELLAPSASVEVLHGPEALEKIAALEEVDSVMAAIVGAAGLRSTLAAVRAGKCVLLANKESLVMAGAFMMAEIERHGAILLPIDSEHNAVFQCLPQDDAARVARRGVRRVLLTASGGPFRNTPLEQLGAVTPEQACAHPNWSMGRKISVDSATMMNKGLEVIEARWLFGVEPERIEVVIHPQSVVHSMVEYLDGSVLAQMGNPDMRTPIAHAMAYPDRIEAGVRPLDLTSMAALSFEAPDFQRFPCLGLAYQALRAGGCVPAVLNAANEVAVAAFLETRIGFGDIPVLIARTLERCAVGPADSLDDVFEADVRARDMASALVGQA